MHSVQCSAFPGMRVVQAVGLADLPPSGVSYDGEGIRPTYPVELPATAAANFYRMTDEEDTQLQKALELVAGMEASTIQ